jgi:hypothetical protein
MGRIIRHTTIIALTQTWTIVWNEDGSSEHFWEDDESQATTRMQEQGISEEETDETIRPAIMPDAATGEQLTEVTVKPKAGSQRKRARRRRDAGNQ